MSREEQQSLMNKNASIAKYMFSGPLSPERDLVYRIVEQWGNAIEMPNMGQWLKDYAAKQRPAGSAVWVKASTRLPSAGKITWRWLDKAEAYSGYDEKRGFVFGTGGASVDPTYYTEIEWLDESGQSKEGNKEQYKFDYKSRDWEQEQTKPASEEAIRRMKERWIAEGKRECPDCGLWFKSEGRCPECNPLG
jgi:hypothetical protein